MGGFWWFQWTQRVMGNISYLALSSQGCLDGWLLVVPMDPEGHVEHLLLSTLLPEVALNLSIPVKTSPVLMPPRLESWRTGVS